MQTATISSFSATNGVSGVAMVVTGAVFSVRPGYVLPKHPR